MRVTKNLLRTGDGETVLFGDLVTIKHKMYPYEAGVKGELSVPKVKSCSRGC